MSFFRLMRREIAFAVVLVLGMAIGYSAGRRQPPSLFSCDHTLLQAVQSCSESLERASETMKAAQLRLHECASVQR